MFEVGFSELLLIMVLALLVLGPQKLPKVVGQVGRWMGRARAMARQFREQLEIEAAEAQRPPQAAAPPQDAAPPISPPTPPPPSAVDDHVRRSDADERREP
jgi:Tat protein translocase TatB subunit